MKTIDKEVAASYDALAASYEERAGEDGDFYHRNFVIPSILRLLGDVKGKRLLDMACGTGVVSRVLARMEANVTGVDISAEMLRYAWEREKTHPLGISYHHGSASDLKGWKEGTFDGVVCNMALMDIADYRGAIAEASRVLLSHGRFVFSMLHPCFCTPDSGWVKRDPNSKKNEDKLYWKVDRYFERASGRNIMEYSWDTIYFHRTLGDYLAAALASGFRIEAVDEPEPSQDLLPDYADMTRIAEFLVVGARKD